MLAQALDALDAPQLPLPEDVTDLVASDLVATLGWTREQARAVVAPFGNVSERDPEHLGFEVAEEVQQWLHDSFLDTSWPHCPSHPNHPLWLSEEEPFTWHCPKDRVPIVRLGYLGAVLPPPTPEQATDAQARLLDELESIRAMTEQLRSTLRRRLRRGP